MMITICWWKSVVISNASEKIGTVTLSIEKFTIGQGYLIEPTQVVLHEGDTCANLVKDILKNNNYELRHQLLQMVGICQELKMQIMEKQKYQM